ncbi:MAG: hypothetical protein JXA89_05460 [Anaerolineae bacterium]|nr:hypothetical protein [Anaerolineae bacterium]
MDEKLELARKAIQQGDKVAARQLLLQVIRTDAKNETAWLWLSAIVDDLERERECLERVLKINPHNEVAQRHLRRLSLPDPIIQPSDSGSQSAPETFEQEPVSEIQSGVKRSRKKTIVIVSIAATALVLCVGLCFGIFGINIVKAVLQRDDIAVVIDNFMQSMSRKEADKAYTLLSNRAKRQTPLSELQDLLQENNFALFSGYQDVQISSISVKTAVNTNPNAPQGTIAEVSGVVLYQGGFIGQFNAILEQDGQWKLFGINVTVPPDKLG